MAQSKVGICNLALSYIRAASIASLTASSPEARECNRHFDQTRDELLQEVWDFATTTVVLAELTNDWDERWTYKYQLPTGCLKPLRLIGVADTPNDPTPHEFEQRGDALYCHLDEAELEYVQQVTDPTKYPTHFVTALAWALAAKICFPVTGDGQLDQTTLRKAETYVARALAVEGNNAGVKRREYEPETVTARK